MGNIIVRMIRYLIFTYIIFTTLLTTNCKKDEDEDIPPITNTNTFSDPRDKQTYSFIKIGQQTWMKENLKYKPKGGWYYANGDESTRQEYGLLYTWDTACKVCPKGWHLPTEEEWQKLELYIGIDSFNLTSTTWDRAPNLGTILLKGGSSGLNLTKAGLWHSTSNPPQFIQFKSCGYYWTSTKNYDKTRLCRVISKNIERYYLFQNHGMSVRCIKD